MSEGGQLASSRTRIWTRSPDGCSNTLSAHRKLSLKEHLKSSCLETKGSCELVFLAWLVEPQRSTVRLQVQKEERLWEHSKSRLESGRQLPLLEPLTEASLPVLIILATTEPFAESKWLTCRALFHVPRQATKHRSHFGGKGARFICWLYFLTWQILNF